MGIYLISPREMNGYSLQYACLENSTDRGALRAQSMGLQRAGHDRATNTFFLSSDAIAHESVNILVLCCSVFKLCPTLCDPIH